MLHIPGFVYSVARIFSLLGLSHTNAIIRAIFVAGLINFVVVVLNVILRKVEIVPEDCARMYLRYGNEY